MPLLLLKLLLTPVFIGAITLAGRRWGPTVSGLFLGMPLTSGSVSLFLALQYGPAFAARAAVGNLAGQGLVCLFCLTYSLASLRLAWPACALGSVAVFLAATALGNRAPWTLGSAALFVLAVILVVSRLIPRGTAIAAAAAAPRWDLPARMIVATAFVLALTAGARGLGPQLSGLIAPFPVFGVVLAAFTHQRQGAGAAGRLMRSMVMGSVAFIAFFLIAGSTLGHLSLGRGYLLASLGAVAASALVLWGLRSRAPLFVAVFGA